MQSHNSCPPVSSTTVTTIPTKSNNSKLVNSPHPLLFSANVVPKWFDISYDTYYLMALLSWIECARNGFYHDYNAHFMENNIEPPRHMPRQISLEIPPGSPIRARMNEPVQSEHWISSLSGSTSRVLEMSGRVKSLYEGGKTLAIARFIRILTPGPGPRLDLYDRYIKNALPCPVDGNFKWPSLPSAGTTSTITIHEYRWQCRESDVDALNHLHNLNYILLFDEFEPTVPRLPTRRIDVEFIREITPGTRITVKWWWIIPQQKISLVAYDAIDSSIIYSRCLREFHQPTQMSEISLLYQPEPRYLRGRPVLNSRKIQELTTKFIKGNLPTQLTTVVAWEDVSNSQEFAVALLRWADSGTAVLWEIIHGTPMSPQLSTPKPGLHFQRAAYVHVSRRPRTGTVLTLNAWISKIGKTSFDMSIDMISNSGFLVATVTLTKVHVDRISGKPAPVLFNIDQIRERFANCRSLKQDYNSTFPQLLLQPMVEYIPQLRHTDQDQNRHLNSALYMHIVHDAKCFAVKNKLFSSSIVELLDRDGWIGKYGIDHILEVTMDDDLRIRMMVDEKRIWFIFMLINWKGNGKDERATVCWVEFASGNDVMEGFIPYFTLEESMLNENRYRRKWGVDAKVWEIDDNNSSSDLQKESKL
jgi:acyl-CoA thioesterase FadM